MSDGVVFADIVMVAQEMAVVRLPGADGGVLGLCWMPSAAVMPAGTWFSAVEERTLPLIAQQTDRGLVVEALISGTPLLVMIQGNSSPSFSHEDYPWTEWSRATSHESWAAHLAHGTHVVVGGMVVAVLLIAIAARRHASTDTHQPGSAVARGSLMRTALGGLLGFGRDSFTRFPPSAREHGKGGPHEH